MIELILVFHLWGRVRDRLFARGYDRTRGYQVMVVVLWFAGQFIGAGCYLMTASIPAGAVNPSEYVNPIAWYGSSLLGGAIGVILVFVLIQLKPQREIPGTEGFTYLGRR